MNYILFDNESWQNFLPLTFTRPISEIRLGILRISEKWNRFLNQEISYMTQDYLSKKYPMKKAGENILINACILPNSDLIEAIQSLSQGQVLVHEGILIAVSVSEDKLDDFDTSLPDYAEKIIFQGELVRIEKAYDIFQLNDKALRDDFELLTKGRQSQIISKTVNVLGGENIFLEEGAKVEFATLNANEGPIYIGKDAEIMEGSLVRGPLAMCEHSALKMGTKVYGATTLGPFCKSGGELSNVVFLGYSNKAHDGFLGNAVIGEWCNIGADTNNSNLKNNYSEVKLWNYKSNRFDKTGLQFCGTIMGDHSKCGINTMLNTGTVIGVSANVYGAGFPRNFIPSFSMGGNHGFQEYRLKAAHEVAQLVMQRRGLEFDKVEEEIMDHVFEITAKYRKSF
ncbi:glucose-1-phosphate thymidylyltransferase [Ancylomarina euxinus]|uniref:Glucose-1-phosphate thymidylyltransferase n=1 Tax=Ancylomarina euxinus TaxID=2283627 RepID=A0A425Y2X2_9BACT|nr:GlmU family protein [Ancylomarina euxinus]MCZ4693198.1 GlmU family protein [Ancylomarina euxinus]MUP15335.1 glucose-1-phosphate thymidylyltransferase [Ancylomarina euxinus]RRG22538.1 glucose-1-phosphate thymidylyltransferase [Ancylomarina euxinus]